MNCADPQPPPRSNLALVASLAIIVIATLTPTRGHNEIHLSPLQDVFDAIHPLSPLGLAGLVGNVLLFAPLGWALRLREVELPRAAFVGIAISATIEVAQLIVPGRTTSVDDVLLNTLGTVLGYLIAERWISRSRRM